MKTYTAMTIAGSDSSGGAGIQADLKTFTAFGVYGASVLTALTAQNTKGVKSVQVLTADFVREQILSVVDDIPMGAVKTGMLAEPSIVHEIAKLVDEGKIDKLVVDPVMISKSGHALLSPRAVKAVVEDLVPRAFVITPNTHEAEELTGQKIESLDDQRESARLLYQMGANHVIVKGGHIESDESIDVYFNGKDFRVFSSRRFHTVHTHGTGCTFSAAITAAIAREKSVIEAIELAKKYITEAIETAPGLGFGNGPVNHLVGVTSRWAV